jgi:hypothetical protein
MLPGSKPVMDDEEFKMISESGAFCSYIAISQVNGDPEKKRTDMIVVLENLLMGKKSMMLKLYF